MTILSGIKIIEIEGIGPGPFCGRHLAELGAEVVTIIRPGKAAQSAPHEKIMRQGKTILELNLKDQTHKQHLLNIIPHADGLIEGMRPGVMERLGLGPDICLGINQGLAYGRLTGWGQTGPLSHSAGHDINYIALSGALWHSGAQGTAPATPPTIVGDIGGGALYLTIGLLSAIIKARTTGKGDVIDAAIVDGSAHMMNLLNSLRPSGAFSDTRGASILDGPHWYQSYECSDGHYVSIGALEPQFYSQLLDILKLGEDPDFLHQMDFSKWPAQKTKLAKIFLGKSSQDWVDLLEATDCCFAPVLSPTKAAEHIHIKDRAIYNDHEGHIYANPAPRFSHHPYKEIKSAKSITADALATAWSNKPE